MNLLIIDDDTLVTASLKMILETDPDIHVLATGKNAQEAVTLYASNRPDVLLMDIRMGEVSGIEAARRILKADSNAKILFLTTFLDDEYIIDALRIGAKGYILKQEYEHILPAIKAVDSGQNVFGDEIISKLPDLMHNTPPFSYEQFQINEREYSIIKLIANGKSNREISEELFLSEGTVRNYLSHILEKLNLRDRTQVAIFYYKHN